MAKDQFYLNIPDFSGPIELLLTLIQEREIDPENIPLVSIIEQYMQLSSNFDLGGESICSLSSLLFLKSEALLPEYSKVQDGNLKIKQETIKSLIEYIKFKKAGEELYAKDKELSSVFTRGITREREKSLGIEHLSLEDLNLLFKELIKKKAADAPCIFEEKWCVSDKITFIKEQFTQNRDFPFHYFFLENQTKIEWIVTFLAVLELMKEGFIQAEKETDSSIIFLKKRQHDE